LLIGKLKARRTLAVLVVVMSVLVAACGPAPLGTSWPSVSLFNDICAESTRQGIMVAYQDRIVMVNPANGDPLSLLNPADCTPRPPDENGNPRIWDFRAGGKQFFTTPVALDNTNLLTIAYDQHLFSIDSSVVRTENTTGVPIGGRTGHAVTDLVLSEDTIYIGLAQKDLVALDRTTYDVRWTFTTEHGVWSKPVLDDGTLYFTSLDHNLYAVNAETGTELWRVDLEGAAAATPLLHEGRLYIGSFARRIYEISTAGEVLSTFDTVDWVWGTPTIVDNTLYVGDLGGNVYALDSSEGLREMWRQKVANGAIRATPIITENRIIVAARDNKVYWLNRADGSAFQIEGIPLVRELEASIFSDILLIEPSETVDIAEPYVVVSSTSTNQLLVAFTLDNGELRWTYRFR
jgi:outer membrane protein assembly factor BamB